ncbi:hypothetical protein B0I35DRAFT_405770 [Stachybotrys elegans]|uniref:Beta-xylosidase n=1 Tax=Stachybotrys elegans TaxID=80388 RepID=A0A8K0WWI8_9HYPO|nr:hypothetical protein B0I35DRAFT_405770 [Stachybotrys elegans]
MMHSKAPAPQYKMLVRRRIAKNPALELKLQQMSLKLAPLVRVDTGDPHPDFPATVLSFWLLTDDQLEALAHAYHQGTPGPWSALYPCPITWDSSLPIEEKRRKIGKFIGLRGCETPIKIQTEEQIAEDARKASLAAEEDIWRRKGYSWRR